jgi:hypothetical protein
MMMGSERKEEGGTMDDVGGCQPSLARLAWASYLGAPPAQRQSVTAPVLFQSGPTGRASELEPRVAYYSYFHRSLP